jgi:hypothetical protein
MLVLQEGSDIMLQNELKKFECWLYEGEDNPEDFGSKLLTLIKRELETRTRKFGTNDPRTEQWQLFLQLSQEDVPDVDAETDLVRESKCRVSQKESLRLRSLHLSHVLNALNDNSTLPLHRQVDMVLRLQSRLRSAKVLTDPLKMLFRIILQKAPIIPIYALVEIGDFYDRVGKLEEALEVHHAALAKVVGQEIPINSLFRQESVIF